MTPDDLIAFEREIADLFAAGRIKAPIHLSGGNEQALIDIFAEVEPDDWVLGTWRSHYHCLLKGVPRETVRTAILDGWSMTLCFPEHRVFCSAIAGGTLPIAVGLGMAGHRVWCFVGDMMAESGIAYEAMRYCAGHGLKVRFVIEDNGMSVCTPTREAWGAREIAPDVRRYRFRLGWPHAGIGRKVAF